MTVIVIVSMRYFLSYHLTLWLVRISVGNQQLFLTINDKIHRKNLFTSPVFVIKQINTVYRGINFL